MEDSKKEWEDFLRYGHIFSPSRDEQNETILSLIPAKPEEHFTFVELGCGGGQLSVAILTEFPQSKAICIDKTDYMLNTARENLAPFGDRVNIKQLDFKGTQWLSEIPDNIRCFVSSLALHHLAHQRKKQLFRQLYAKLDERGAVLVVDIVEPTTEQVREYFGRLWNQIVRQQSQEKTGSLDVYNHFKQIEWNYYQWDEPDEEDTPSFLFDQLKWLEEAGFTKTDCFWMRAGHAIYGGYKQ